jgi:hypothetical protein
MNTKRWIVAAMAAALAALIECLTDKPTGDTVRDASLDYLRHGLLNLGVAVLSLKLTLDRPGM